MARVTALSERHQDQLCLPCLIIDNYDSYTHNLFQLCWTVSGVQPLVIKNDDLPAFQRLSQSKAFSSIIVSPGPGRPDKEEDFGLCLSVLKHPPVPVLGVCLGFQGLGYAYGMQVNRAPGGAVHGRTSQIFHNDSLLFADIPQGSSVVRYHSLALCRADGSRAEVPDDLEEIAWTKDGIIMGIRHRTLPLWGVQFHPESVCTECGETLIKNFLEIVRKETERTMCCEGTSFVKELDVATEVREGREGVRGEHWGLGEGQGSLHPAGESGILQVVYEALSFSNDADIVFSALFAKEEHSFWLDSNRTDMDSRFSFMGGCSGPLSFYLEYFVKERRLTVRTREEVSRSQEGVDLFSFIQNHMRCNRVDSGDLPFDFCGGFVGYIGYELKEICEDGENVRNRHLSEDPDAALIFADRFLAFDHHEGRCYVVAVAEKSSLSEEEANRWVRQVVAAVGALDARSALDTEVATMPVLDAAVETSARDLGAAGDDGEDTPSGPGAISMPPLTPSAPAPSHGPGSVPKGAFPLMDCVERPAVHCSEAEFVPDDSKELYMKKIDDCHEYIRDGESYELCLTTRLRCKSRISPYRFYCRQRRLNPAPYSAFLRLSDRLSVCSSSPERFLRISKDGWVESKPIKGTRRRGQCPEEDQHIAKELQLCEKDRAENLMIVDLVRNDLGRICQTGSVHCPKLMSIETYTTVHQLVSTIRGKLLPHLDALDCVRATFPMGSMTGAPKRRSLVLLDELEASARGIYSGSIGYFSLNGAADLSVCIRTGVFNEEGIKLGAGGAITILSKAEEEWEEMLLKTKALVQCARTFYAEK